MDIWQKHFPHRWAEIAKGRSSDSILDSICRDFELLIVNARPLPAEADQEAFQFQANIRDSLKSLSEEICMRLDLQDKDHTQRTD
ncbi:MAG: hypothetical protein ABJP66_20410 [Hyphomicrobiales bacterium]